MLRVPRRPEFICRALEEDARLYRRAARLEPGKPALAVLIAYYLALRCFEIASLRWDAFSSDCSEVTIVGKGRKTATLPVHPVLARVLRQTLREGAYVFPGGHGHGASRAGQGVAPYTIRKWLTAFCERHELPRINPHKLRHTSLATMHDETSDLRGTQTFARHARPETTAGYTRTKWRALHKCVMALPRDEDLDEDAAA